MPVDAYVAAYAMNPWGLMQRQIEFQTQVIQNGMQISVLATLATLKMMNGMVQAYKT